MCFKNFSFGGGQEHPWEFIRWLYSCLGQLLYVRDSGFLTICLLIIICKIRAQRKKKKIAGNVEKQAQNNVGPGS